MKPFDQAMNLWTDKYAEVILLSNCYTISDHHFDMKLYSIVHPTANLGKGHVFWHIRIGPFVFNNYSAEFCYKVYTIFKLKCETTDNGPMFDLLKAGHKLIWDNPEDMKDQMDKLEKQFIQLATKLIEEK